MENLKINKMIGKVCGNCNNVVYDFEHRICERCGQYTCLICLGSYEENNNNQVKYEYCPYCSGNSVTDKMFIDYLVNKYGLDIEKVKKEINLNKER